MKKILLILTLLTAFVTSTFAVDTKQKVSLQLVWKHQFQFAGFYIAKEKGFYKEANIDIDIKEYKFGTDITEDILSGKTDIGIGRSSLILDKLNGKDVLLLGALYQSSPYVLISKKRDDLKTVEDFKDKRIMISDDLESVAAISSMMRIKNITKKDYKHIQHSFNIDDLIDDKVDLVTTYLSNEPFYLKEKGIDISIFNPKDYGFDFYEDIIFTSNKYKNTNPVVLNKFYKASLKGWKYAFEHIDETVNLILKKYNTQHKTKEALQYEAKILKKLAFKKDIEFGNISLLRIREIANIYRLLGLTNKPNKYLNALLYTPLKRTQLTKQELQYLGDMKIVKMCNKSNWEPIEFEDSNHLQSGISIDTLKLIEKKLEGKIKFKQIHTTSWSQSQQFLKEKKCDILPSAIKTKKREKYAIFTKPYLNYKLAIITQNDKPLVNDVEDIIKNNKTIARKKGSGLIAKLKRHFPNVKIVETKDYLSSLQKVSNGEVYSTIATLPVASYFINKFALNNLHIAGYTDMTYRLSIAIRDDKPELLSILDKVLAQISKQEHQKIYNKWANVNIKEGFDFTYIINILIVIVVIALLLMYRQYILKKHNDTLEKLVDEKTFELKEINENLEQKIIIEIEKNRHNEQQLFEQAKMVSMGEMIGNIAHQWRQPLSVISTSSTGMEVQRELGILEDEMIKKTCATINENAQYLSKTIDDFRNYIKGDTVLEDSNMKEIIENFLNLVKSHISKYDINVVLDLQDDIQLKSYPNELIQCFINIFNNAKDILNEKNIEKKLFFITAYKKDDKIIIKFRDNASGVPEDIIDKIFEPYFTTKHQSQGTGLGLHMTYDLIVKGMGGILEVENIIYNYEEKDYVGAEFKIILDLK